MLSSHVLAYDECLADAKQQVFGLFGPAARLVSLSLVHSAYVILDFAVLTQLSTDLHFVILISSLALFSPRAIHFGPRAHRSRLTTLSFCWKVLYIFDRAEVGCAQIVVEMAEW